jgi:hypothetical protein
MDLSIARKNTINTFENTKAAIRCFLDNETCDALNDVTLKKTNHIIANATQNECTISISTSTDKDTRLDSFVYTHAALKKNIDATWIPIYNFLKETTNH